MVKSKESPKAEQPMKSGGADNFMADVTDVPKNWGAFGEYTVDVAQRTVLFWDLLRRRSEQYYANKAEAMPSVLSFDSEMVLDARTFAKPVNYFLARIIPPSGTVTESTKRPFIVVDPRAGHGPGIGGFKADSELGVAMRTGHPCYFVGFTPEPMAGQTIEDVMHAEAIFIDAVIELHPEVDGKPCVIGNCQAGWAVMMLAAMRPELCGPLIVIGSPLSYWAGIEGENPMRYSGGLLGGSWLTALTSDLRNGKFDGGHLVRNFENLNPANTLWSKQYDIWASIDGGAERFLEFEKWWGGHVNMNAEEIQWIVDNLFIGNRLATAELVTRSGGRIDLRNIRSPIICFCSKGDNITPPPQALGWIIDLYANDDDIRACGQTIIYTVHDSVGHLGIFVSANVAKKEHREFASNIDLIDILPPGIYEAVMTPKTADAAHQELISGDWIVRFEPRKLEDIRNIVQPSLDNERRFAAARRVSEINLGLYQTCLQPFVKTAANHHCAGWLQQFNPFELPIEFFSERNSLMRPVAQLADRIRAERHQASEDNPFVEWQAAASEAIVAGLDGWRDLRDATMEQTFMAAYNSPVLQAMVGIRATDESPRRRPGHEPDRIAFIEERIEELKANMAEGDVRDAAIRCLGYIGMGGRGVDERTFNQLVHMRCRYGDISIEDFKRIVRNQYFSLLLDEKAALDAIPLMLPADVGSRAKLLEDIRCTVSAAGDMNEEQGKRLSTIEALFAIAPKPSIIKKRSRRANDESDALRSSASVSA